MSLLCTQATPLLAQTEAPSAVVRVACDGPAAGAAVTVNGVFKGDCPVDVPVVAGNVRLRATKAVDAMRELVFEHELRLVAGTAKRVDVEFGAPQLNAAGLREEAARQAAARARAAQEAADRRVSQLALVAKAEAGDKAAMVQLANWIAEHDEAPGPEGADKRSAYHKAQAEAALKPPADPVLVAWYRGSTYWYQQAAQRGDAMAALLLHPNQSQTPAWLLGVLRRHLAAPMPDVRTLHATGIDAVASLVDGDPFFRGADGSAALSGDYRWSPGETRDLNCKRVSARAYSVAGKRRVKATLGDDIYAVDTTAALGGLVTLSFSEKRFFQSTEWRLHTVEAVYGQPFPWRASSRFGITYRREASGPVFQLHCGWFEAQWNGAAVPAAACYETQGASVTLLVRVLDAASGCFHPTAPAWSAHP